MHLQLESATDVLRLDDVLMTGKGAQAISGLTGFGLPPVNVQWLEGAGDGATFRTKRLLPRDIDLPLYIDGSDREGLKTFLARLAHVLAGECTLRLVEDHATASWSTKVHRTGGGDFIYGSDTTGERDLSMVITLRAGNPFWLKDEAESVTITNAGSGDNFMSQLAHLRVTPAQAIGKINLENEGDAEAFPVWTVIGPGTNFEAISPSGERIAFEPPILGNEVITIDTATGLVTDQDGDNRYSDLAPSPRLWTVPPGLSIAEARMDAVSAGGFGRIGSYRTNHVINPAFEVNLSGYSAFGPGLISAERDTSIKHSGLASMKLVTGGSTNYYSGMQFDIAGLEPFKDYVCRVQSRMHIGAHEQAQTIVGNGTSVPYSYNKKVKGSWFEHVIPFTAPASGQTTIWLNAGAWNGFGFVETSYWFDQIFVGEAGSYFDGTTPDTSSKEHVWEGAAHASKSTAHDLGQFGASSIKCEWRPRKTLVI